MQSQNDNIYLKNMAEKSYWQTGNKKIRIKIRETYSNFQTGYCLSLSSVVMVTPCHLDVLLSVMSVLRWSDVIILCQQQYCGNKITSYSSVIASCFLEYVLRFEQQNLIDILNISKNIMIALIKIVMEKRL